MLPQSVTSGAEKKRKHIKANNVFLLSLFMSAFGLEVWGSPRDLALEPLCITLIHPLSDINRLWEESTRATQLLTLSGICLLQQPGSWGWRRLAWCVYASNGKSIRDAKRWWAEGVREQTYSRFVSNYMSSAITLRCESVSVIISVCRTTGVIWDELCSTFWSAENSIIVASINHQEVPEKSVSCWSSDTEPVIRRENLTWIQGRTVALWVKLRWLPFSDRPALKNLSDLSASAIFRVINLGIALKKVHQV